MLFTFLEPNGAQRNTQNPHILNFEGVVTVSHDVCPAPTVSPLNDEYNKQMQNVGTTLNKMMPEAIKTYRFTSLDKFADIMRDLIETTTPYDINTKK